MFAYQYLVLCCVITVLETAEPLDYVALNLLDSDDNPKEDAVFFMGYRGKEQVEIQLYYGSWCMDCRIFCVTSLAPTVQKLSKNLVLHLYPYGNSYTIIDDYGKFDIHCQNGPGECYGNMLHACAIKKLHNVTKAALFNSCMMEPSDKTRGSDDEAAEMCGDRMHINVSSIKSCAKGPEGLKLLKRYGEKTKEAAFYRIPYILVNGEEYGGDDLFRDVCETFIVPNEECTAIKQ